MNSLQANQAYLFSLFILNGILIGIVFDIFRILRKSFKTTDFITYIEDTLFWIVSGMITIYFLFVFNNGEIRFYIFIGIFLGVALYILSISKYFININVKLIAILKNIIGKILSIILYPIKLILKMMKKTFLRPISFVFINIRKIMTKNTIKLKDNLKKLNNNAKKTDIKKDF